MTKSAKDKYTDPELRDKIKEEVQAGDKGGEPGQWSARKAQMMAKEYKAAGGGYKDDKKDEKAKHLDKWTEEDWQTKDGDGDARTEEGTHRYLPKRAWEQMTEEEKEATDKEKMKGSNKGEQYVPNTPKAKKARKAVSDEDEDDNDENNDDDGAEVEVEVEEDAEEGDDDDEAEYVEEDEDDEGDSKKKAASTSSKAASSKQANKSKAAKPKPTKSKGKANATSAKAGKPGSGSKTKQSKKMAKDDDSEESEEEPYIEEDEESESSEAADDDEFDPDNQKV